MDQISSNIEYFNKNGYIYYPSFFSLESKKLINNLNQIFKLNKNIPNKKYGFVDGVTFNENLWDLIVNEKLLKKISLILGNDFKYIRHSDLHINYKGGLIHRDSSNRYMNEEENWDSKDADYKILRVAIYLTDYKETESSIIVFPGSHIKENYFLRFRVNLYNFIKSKLRKLKIDNFLPVKILFNNYVNIKNLQGDLLIFDQRILHCGGNSLFKNKPKYSIFLGYGARNIHTVMHEEYYSKRKGYDKKIPDKLKILLNSKQLI